MCTCRKNIEEKLLARFKKQSPEAVDHAVRLLGYGLFLDDAGIKEKGCMPFRLTAVYPVRKGGFKHKKVEQSMIFTYCPFCAEKLEPTAESGVA